MIVHETLDQIANFAAVLCERNGGDLNEDVLATIKRGWPDLRFTLCSDDDMPARMPPALQRETLNLYLVNGNEHCLSLTDDPMYAIGVVLATIPED